MKKSLRNLLIFLGIALLLLVGYFAFFKTNSAPAQTGPLASTNRASTTTPLAASQGATTGNQLLALLGRVSTLTLNDDIFANPAFDMLQDISIVLPPIEARGRRNPFAPISANNAATAAATGTVSATSSITTGNTQ